MPWTGAEVTPTYESLPRFWDDWKKLSSDEQAAFKAAVRQFVEDLERGGGRFRKGLRVRRIEGTKDIWELTWSMGMEGGATWQYGEQIQPGEAHVMWRRIGGHAIFGSP